MTTEEDTSQSSTMNPTTIPLVNFPNIHSITPVPTIKRFDGSRPEEIQAILQECENTVISANPSLANKLDSVEFSNACLNNVVHRLDLSKPAVASAYHIWRMNSAPNWSSLKKELYSYFQTDFLKAAQACAFVMDIKPIGNDREALLNHVSKLNEPFRIMVELMQREPILKDIFNQDKLHIIRNFLFVGSMLKTSIPKYHYALLDKVSMDDSPSLTCTNISEAISHVIGKGAVIQPIASITSSRQHQVATLQNNPPSYHNASSWKNNFNKGTQNHDNGKFNNSKPSAHNKYKTSSNTMSLWTPQRGNCFNCGETNHMFRQCKQNPFCWFHKVEGHSWYNCKTFPDAVRNAKVVIANMKNVGFQPEGRDNHRDIRISQNQGHTRR